MRNAARAMLGVFLGEFHVRLTSFAAAALIVSMSGSAFAEDWIEYTSKQDRFTCNFPGEPKVTEKTFLSQFGTPLPSRVYSVDLGPAHNFSLTVVDYSNITELAKERAKSCPPGAETCLGGTGAPGNSTGPGYSKADRAGAMLFATWMFMQRDAKVTHLLWTNINLVEGNMIRLQNNKDKSLTAATIFMHEDKLYIAEGTVPAGYPEPGLFYQSLGWTDENGNNIRYSDFYHDGFPKPPVMGRGGAAGAGAQQGGANQGGRAQGAGAPPGR